MTTENLICLAVGIILGAAIVLTVLAVRAYNYRRLLKQNRPYGLILFRP